MSFDFPLSLVAYPAFDVVSSRTCSYWLLCTCQCPKRMAIFCGIWCMLPALSECMGKKLHGGSRIPSGWVHGSAKRVWVCNHLWINSFLSYLVLIDHFFLVCLWAHILWSRSMNRIQNFLLHPKENNQVEGKQVYDKDGSCTIKARKLVKQVEIEGMNKQ